MQRTLILSSVRGQITLDPVQNMKPWCDNKERFPNLFQGEGQRDSLLFTRMVSMISVLSRCAYNLTACLPYSAGQRALSCLWAPCPYTHGSATVRGCFCRL